MDLSQILINAQNSDHATRSHAEQQLNQAVEAQYGPFTLALCQEFATEGKPETVRQLAGLYLKNLISAQDQLILEQKKDKWVACDAATKTNIRNGFLQALASPVQVVSHTAAQVIAGFASVDVPSAQWPTLLSTLFQNVSSADVALGCKIASLEALGYMCDAMNPDEVQKPVVDQLLSTIVDGMRADRPNEMRLAAVSAMCNSLDFTENNFEVDVERDMIMKAICEACQCSELKVRVKAYECLAGIANLYYAKLPAYVSTLFQMTVAAIKTDDPLVGQQAIEFWSTVGDTECEMVAEIKEAGQLQEGVYLKLIEQAATSLIPVVLETLMKQDEDDEDNENWNIAKAGAACLEVIAITLGDSIVGFVIPFVSQYIATAEWRSKEAAIMSFGMILGGPSSEVMQQYVAGALPMLVNCVADPSRHVRDTSAWAIGRICQYHTSCIAADMIHPMITALSAALGDESSAVTAQACFAIHNMADACEDESEANSNVLSNFMPVMLQKLLTVVNREDWDTNNLRSTAYEAVNMMVTNSAMDMQPVVIHVLGEALNRLEANFNQQCEQQERMNLQSHLCSLIGICVQKLPVENIKETSDRIMQLTLMVFNSKGAVAQEDAFMAVGYLAAKLDSDFGRYATHLSPALLQGLKNFEEHSVCTVAIGVAGDLARALGKGVAPFCDDIMRCILELLQSQTVNRAVKPHAISLFADIAMAIEGDFERYTSIVMPLLEQAGNVNITDVDDEDQVDYINTLRESILEAFTGIIQGLKSDSKENSLAIYIDHIMNLIRKSTEDSNCADGVLKASVGLVGDLGHCYTGRMFTLFSQPFIMTILQQANGMEEMGTVTKWTSDIVQQVLAGKGAV